MADGPEYRRLTLTPDNPGPPRKITITDVEKRANFVGMTHHVYIIQCEPHFPKVVSVARRYRQFLWLRNVLMQQYPCVFCPNLPQKAILKDDKFIEERRADLERFLNRLEEIDLFHSNKALLIFLTCPESTFDAKTKEFEKTIELVSPEVLRNKYADCLSLKLPTDLDFEISRFKDDFTVQKVALEGLLKQCFTLLGLYEKAQTQMQALNDAIGDLSVTENQFPRRDLDKRVDKNLEIWEKFHEKMWETFLSGFCRQIRYELQDALAMIDIVDQLDNERTNLQSIRRVMEKWAVKTELTFEQQEQKKADGAKETILTDMVEVCAKMVFKICEDGWISRVEEYREALRTFTFSMMKEWKVLSEEEFEKYREF